MTDATHHAQLVALREEAPRQVAVPDGLTLGRPFRTMSVGAVASRFTGAVRGEATVDDLTELARVFRAYADTEPVVIDWSHGSTPFDDRPKSPDVGVSLGQVVDAYVDDPSDGRGPGLYVVPAYTPRGLRVLAENRGALWSSPEFFIGNVFDRGEPEKLLGKAQLMAVALTNRPAQRADRIDAVRLTESSTTRAEGPKETHMDPEEMKPDAEAPEGEEAPEAPDYLDAAQARIAELEAQLAEALAKLETQANTEATAEVSTQALTEAERKVASLEAKVQRLTEAQHQRDRKDAIDAVIAKGHRAPAERALLENAYDLRGTKPGDALWQALSEAGGPRTVPIGPPTTKGSATDKAWSSLDAIGKEQILADEVVALAETKHHGNMRRALAEHRAANITRYEEIGR